MTTEVFTQIGGYRGVEPELRPLDCIPPMNEYIAFADALGALTSELARRRNQGEAVPAAAIEALLGDVRDAAACRDEGRLAWLGANARVVLGGLIEHLEQGRQLLL